MLVHDSNQRARRKPPLPARPTKPAPQGGILRQAKPSNVATPNYSPPQPARKDAKKRQNKVQTAGSPVPQGWVSTGQLPRPNIGRGEPATSPRLAPPPAQALTLWNPHVGGNGANDRTSIVSTKLCDVLTAIDQGSFRGRMEDLTVDLSSLTGALEPRSRSLQLGQQHLAARRILPKGKALNPFAKVDLYANSRLPENLPPTKLYLPAWPLICVAAQYSERVYDKPKGAEKHLHVQPDRTGTERAMVIKSVPVDHMDVIVFAIRGTQSFRDWATNFNADAASPVGFLDDPGNFCHAGFLEVAKKMITPVANRLRAILEDNPARSACSLIITGHSAGGAVASLLFCHMLSSSATSDLATLARSFKRIHCITFGAPPVSGLPLLKPQSWQHRKSLFLSFVNEGDPVTRADPAYVRSLLDLYLAPAPSAWTNKAGTTQNPSPWSQFKHILLKKPNQPPAMPIPSGQVWPVPPCSLSNAGRVILLRNELGKNYAPVYAVTTSDQGLRGAVFGNPLMHMMKTYRERVEELAARAITGGAWS